MYTDPVCGMTVSEKTPYRHPYQGRTYMFCSLQCMHSFREDPEAYLPHEASSQPETHPSGLYVCPLHPYAMQSGPGPCPKCGEQMVPIENMKPEDIEFVTGSIQH